MSSYYPIKKGSAVEHILPHNLGYFSQNHLLHQDTFLVLVERSTENAELVEPGFFHLCCRRICWQKRM